LDKEFGILKLSLVGHSNSVARFSNDFEAISDTVLANMETLLFIIACLLGYIAFKIFELAKNKRQYIPKHLTDTTDRRIPTTQNPVFPEKEILEKVIRHDDTQQEVLSLHETEMSLVSKEVGEHRKAGGSADDFIPSKELERVVKEFITKATMRNLHAKGVRMMVEANINALSGQTIEVAGNKYYDSDTFMPFPLREKEADEYLRERKKTWKEQWDNISNGNWDH